MRCRGLFRLLLLCTGLAVAACTAGSPVPADGTVPAEQLRLGAQLYGVHCAACHRPDGAGIRGVYPELRPAGLGVLDEAAAIRAVLFGSALPDAVGSAWEGTMPVLPLDDAAVAAVVTYIRNAWGGAGGLTDPRTVQLQRRQAAAAEAAGDH